MYKRGKDICLSGLKHLPQNNGFTIIQNSTSLILVYASNLFKYEVKISASIKETTHKTW